MTYENDDIEKTIVDLRPTISPKAVRDAQKLPARVQRIVDRVNAGEKLCIHLHQKVTGATEEQFFFEPSGERCPAKSARAAIESGWLKPSGDGLFGADTSQTWKPKDEEAGQ
jgi:hypothetical protein